MTKRRYSPGNSKIVHHINFHPVPSYDPGKDRTLSSIYEEYRQTSELLLSLGTGAGTLTIRGLLQQP